MKRIVELSLILPFLRPRHLKARKVKYLKKRNGISHQNGNGNAVKEPNKCTTHLGLICYLNKPMHKDYTSMYKLF